MKWRVTCFQCLGDGELFDCIDGCCMDADLGCDDCAFTCDLCKGEGSFIVTELTEDNCDNAIPVGGDQ